MHPIEKFIDKVTTADIATVEALAEATGLYRVGATFFTDQAPSGG